MDDNVKLFFSERLRISRSVALEGEDEAANFLGVEGKVFKFEDAPVQVSVCSASVSTSDIQNVVHFLLGAIS